MNRHAQLPQSAVVTATPVEKDAADERAITFRGMCIFGPKASRSPPQDVPARAISIPVGRTHTISVRFAEERSGFSRAELSEWANAGGVFFQVEWVFAGTTGPKFSTRHELVQGQSFDIAFSGGFDWTTKLLSLFQRFNSNSRRTKLGTRQHGSSNIACAQTQGIFLPNTSHISLKDGLSQPLSLCTTAANLGQPSLGPSPNQDPSSYDPIRAADQPGSPESRVPDTASRYTPDWDSEDEEEECSLDKQPENQLIRETLEQGWRDAEVQYRTNGDTRAYFAILDEASGYSHVWKPSGSPLF